MASSQSSAGDITADLLEWTQPQISQFVQSLCGDSTKVSVPNITGKELAEFSRDQLSDFVPEILPNDSKLCIRVFRELDQLRQQSKQSITSGPSSRQCMTTTNENIIRLARQFTAEYIDSSNLVDFFNMRMSVCIRFKNQQAVTLPLTSLLYNRRDMGRADCFAKLQSVTQHFTSTSASRLQQGTHLQRLQLRMRCFTNWIHYAIGRHMKTNSSADSLFLYKVLL